MANPHPQPVQIGSQYGKWTALREAEPIKRADRPGNIRIVECKCVCGRVAMVRLIHLRGGRSKGCRHCSERKVRASPGRNPNARYVTTNRTYRIYRGMIARCTYPSATGWPRYGGRGINVCPRWREDYANFLADMGDAPDGLSIDRRDNDGDYTPSNCYWATDSQQRANKSWNGKRPATHGNQPAVL